MASIADIENCSDEYWVVVVMFALVCLILTIIIGYLQVKDFKKKEALGYKWDEFDIR